MQSADELNQTFAIPGLLSFDEEHAGMPRARVTTPACTAELFLQGGHLTQWQPSGQEPVLFLSTQSAFAPGKAIRGGIPVIFPWFGAPANSPVHPPSDAPSHGFARTSPWTLRFAALAGDDLHLSLTLDSSQARRALGFGDLQLGLDLTVGATLSLRLTIANAASSSSSAPLLVEEALHSYLHIGNIHDVGVAGLAGTAYLDKTEGFQRKIEAEEILRFQGETDRPYLDTEATVTVQDPVLRRRLEIRKQNSRTTVVWNPGEALAARLADLTPGSWQQFVCVETANVASDALRLLPGEAHTMTMQLSVLPLETKG